MHRTDANEKRQCNVLNIEQKMKIFKQFENNISFAALAKTRDIGQQTVRHSKEINQITELAAFSAKAISNRKSLKGSTFRKLNDAMTR